jgi:hypothetical protein
VTTIAEFLARRPAQFGPIVSIAFAQSQEPDEEVVPVLELCLSRSPHLDGDRIRLRFTGVRGLRLALDELSLTRLGTIELRESPDGLRVTDDEGQLQFDCASFEILPSE